MTLSASRPRMTALAAELGQAPRVRPARLPGRLELPDGLLLRLRRRWRPRWSCSASSAAWSRPTAAELQRHGDHVPGVRGGRHRGRPVRADRARRASPTAIRTEQMIGNARGAPHDADGHRHDPARLRRSSTSSTSRSAPRSSSASSRSSSGLDLHASGILPVGRRAARVHPVRLGPRAGQRRRDPHLPPRRRRDRCSASTLLGLASGAFFPLALLPDWIASVAEYNPLAIAIEGMREALLGGTGWSEVGGHVALLVPMSIASLLGGAFVFRLALGRERRRGTLGLY